MFCSESLFSFALYFPVLRCEIFGQVVLLRISADCQTAVPGTCQFELLCGAGQEAHQELPVSTLPFMPVSVRLTPFS